MNAPKRPPMGKRQTIPTRWACLLSCCALLAPALAQDAAAPAAPAADALEEQPAVAAPAPAPAEPVAPVVPAEAPAAVEAPVAPPVEPAPVTAPVVSQPATGSQDLISVTLEDVALPEVVRLFTRLSGANIIAATTNLRGSVTANLRNVEWRPAFESILERQDLLLIEKPPESGIFVIESKPIGSADPLVAETYTLSYVAVPEAARVVQEVLKGDGSVVPFSAGNAIIVQAPAVKQSEVKRILQALDLPRQQVYIEAKIVELSDASSKKLGIDWSMLDGYQMGVDSLLRDYQSLEERLKGSDTRTESRASQSLDQWNRTHNNDSRNPRYDSAGNPIEVDSIEVVTVPGSSPLIVEHLIPSREVLEERDRGSEFLNFNGNTATRTTADARSRSVSDLRTAVFSADALQVVLSALQTADDTSVLSNPKIIVANEQLASIDMSTKYPYVEVEIDRGTQDSPGDNISTKLAVIPGKNEPFVGEAFFSYGIKLDVTPRINNASNITVNIEPTISALAGEVTYAEFLTYPIINSKRVKTVFSLGDGKTAAIGGLIRTEDRDVVKKIPLLGDIPLIGKYLFSHQEKRKVQIETIIFVTVGIVKPDGRELGVPEGSRLVQKHIDPEGRLISMRERNAAAAQAPVLVPVEAVPVEQPDPVVVVPEAVTPATP